MSYNQNDNSRYENRVTVNNGCGGNGSGGGGTTGGATEAKQDLTNTKLDTVNTKLDLVAKDGTDITTAVLPAGGTGIRGYLSAIWEWVKARMPALGQATMAASTPVVIANDQSAIPVSIADIINGSQISKSYTEAVALGLIVDASGVNKSGENPDVDTGTLPEAVWNGGGAHTGFPTSAPVGGSTELQVVSSSAADIGTLFITYLETSASTQYTTIGVPVTGVTPSNTGINAYRVHTAYYSSTANPSTQFNAGTIQVRYRQNNAVVFLAMPIGRNQTYMSGYTIPAGKKGLLLPTTWTVAGAAGNTISGAMYIREFGKSPRFRRNVKASFGVPARDEYTVPIVLPALTDVMPYITLANGNNIIAQALFDIILLPA